MCKVIVRVLAFMVGFLAPVPVFIVGFAFVPCEGYNYIYPSIDTRYALSYSERAFSQVTNGMSIDVVRQMLGPPLYEKNSSHGELEWSFTRDGKCFWGDFAWLYRGITFHDGRVIRTEKRIYYD